MHIEITALDARVISSFLVGNDAWDLFKDHCEAAARTTGEEAEEYVERVVSALMEAGEDF